MALFKSGNPALSEKRFRNTFMQVSGEVMTKKGTLNKFIMLSLLLIASASLTWKAFYDGASIYPLILIGVFGGLAVAITLAFKPNWSPFLAPVYALVEGMFVGGVSAYYNFAFAEIAPGIVMQAVGLTFGTAIAMYLLYYFQIIKATQKFKSIVITATAGIAIFYLIAMVLHFFKIDIPFLHQGSTIGIVFSLIVVALAAMNLILDFDMIDQGSAMGAPKYMEWYGAFGLMVTIVWLYIEILRLLSKLSSRN
jgi:uncharacterized YccA/Bax inhibitor family protein